MTETHPLQILTVNSGSSSMKLALYAVRAGTGQEKRLFSMEAERIGQHDSRVRAARDGEKMEELPLRAETFTSAFSACLDWLHGKQDGESRIDAVSHRVVHGGLHYRQPHAITDALLEDLRGLIAVDPAHMPQAIACIEAARKRYPRAEQIACFDTAFHRTMPLLAQRFALPRRYFDQGILRFGFHGLSYEYIVSELRKTDAEHAGGRVIVAHLGNGASMAAICEGKSMETSMGFTPVAGLVMGTRCGDLDPGLLSYLAGEGKMSAAEIDKLITKESGLLGVSGCSQDMRDLLDREASDAAAAEAIALFCYRAKMYVGAYAAVLGGLDMLVFTAGVGEHAGPVRERICAGLQFLGVEIDAGRNRENAAVVSSDRSRVTVRVIPTDEDKMMARHAARLLAARGKMAQRRESNEDSS